MRADDVRRIPVRAIRVRASPAAATSAASLPGLRTSGTLSTLGTPGTLVTSGALGTLSTPGALGTPGTLATHGPRGTPSRLPSPFIRARLSTGERRTNALRLSGAQVETADVAVLRRRIDDVWILGIAPRLKPVTASHDVPIARANPPRAERSRWSALRPVVLRTAAHVVERLRVVDRYSVILRDRYTRDASERGTFVVRFVEPAVVADQKVSLIARIEFDDVMIDVHPGLFPVGLPPGLAAVCAAIEIGVDRVDGVWPIRIDEDLLVVRRAAAAVPVTRRFGRCRRGTSAPPAPCAPPTP